MKSLFEILALTILGLGVSSIYSQETKPKFTGGISASLFNSARMHHGQVGKDFWGVGFGSINLNYWLNPKTAVTLRIGAFTTLLPWDLFPVNAHSRAPSANSITESLMATRRIGEKWKLLGGINFTYLVYEEGWKDPRGDPFPPPYDPIDHDSTIGYYYMGLTVRAEYQIKKIKNVFVEYQPTLFELSAGKLNYNHLISIGIQFEIGTGRLNSAINSTQSQ